MPGFWCVVVEHFDGTVGVTGPLDNEEAADTEALRLATEIGQCSGKVATSRDGHDTSTWLLHDLGDPDGDVGDTAWVYTQGMTAPGA